MQTNWGCRSEALRFCKNASGSSLESLIVTWFESSHYVKNVTRFESSHHLSQRDSSRVRVTKNRDSSRVESLTRVTLSLHFKYRKESYCVNVFQKGYHCATIIIYSTTKMMIFRCVYELDLPQSFLILLKIDDVDSTFEICKKPYINIFSRNLISRKHFSPKVFFAIVFLIILNFSNSNEIVIIFPHRVRIMWSFLHMDSSQHSHPFPYTSADCRLINFSIVINLVPD